MLVYTVYISIFKSKCIFSTRPLVSRCAVCCTTIFSRMHHTRISNETETKTTNWVVLDAQKNHFTFPQKGAYYFLQCLKEYFHLWRHFEVSSLLLFSVVSGSDNAMTNFSDRHRSHLRLPPLYGYALL